MFVSVWILLTQYNSMLHTTQFIHRIQHFNLKIYAGFMSEHNNRHEHCLHRDHQLTFSDVTLLLSATRHWNMTKKKKKQKQKKRAFILSQNINIIGGIILHPHCYYKAWPTSLRKFSMNASQLSQWLDILSSSTNTVVLFVFVRYKIEL